MKILVLSPHTDDEVLGAGGSIARWAEEGHDVICIAFTDCGIIKLIDECEESCRVLGAKFGIADFEVRNFHNRRQEILDFMLKLKEMYAPDLVLCPSKNDVHQDHQVVTEEAMRAFKHCSILGYEMPWNNYAFESDYFVKLTDKHVGAKMQAIDCYKSQSHRPYVEHEYILSHSRVRGIQVGSKYAETFQLIRWIH